MDKKENPKKKHPVLKALLIFFLIIVVVVGIGAFRLSREYKEYTKEIEEAQKGIIGSEVPDFTVTTTEGEKCTLSRILEEKEVVVLNIFTTWCGPCEIEFPEFENNYQKYNDKLEIISLSGDSDETMEDVASYKEEHGLSFPMGITGGEETFDFVPVKGYPTTMVIDRNRKAVFCNAGTIREREAFEALVTSFMGDDYDGTPVFLYQVNSHDGEKYIPASSEGGHSTFAPFDKDSQEFHDYMEKKIGTVPGVEPLVSGMGLRNMYEWWKETRGVPDNEAFKKIEETEPNDRPKYISRASDTDPVAAEMMRLFVKMLARFASDAATLFLPLGGFYLAGGTVQKDLRWLERDNLFMKYFEKNYNPNIRPLLNKIPVYIIKDYSISLYGAANASLNLQK